MLVVHPQYIKDANGEKSLVVLPDKEFDSLMEELEEMEDIRLYDEAKKMIPVKGSQWKKLLR